MSDFERDVPDAPGCPLLGLAVDRRTRYTFPHPDHRCFASHVPATIDSHRQSTYCLSRSYAACDRYQAWQRQNTADGTPEPRLRTGGPPTAMASTAATAAVGVTTVIHIFRSGDALARIAAAYGLTVEQVATANRLTVEGTPADGQRLVIPLGQPAASMPGAGSVPRADRSS